MEPGDGIREKGEGKEKGKLYCKLKTKENNNKNVIWESRKVQLEHTSN